MTVSLDKKQIHLGWETAVAVIIAVVAAGWAFGEFTASFLQKQDKIIYSQTIIIRSLDRINQKDSLQDAQITKGMIADTLVKSRINNLESNYAYIANALKPHPYQERLSK